VYHVSKTKRIVADVPEDVAINFKIAVLKSGKKISEAITEALANWIKAQENEESDESETQLREVR